MLKSENVGLAPLTLADSSIMWQWINDREEVIFNSAYKPVNESQHNAWFEAIQQRRDVVIFGIRLIEADRLIGTCQLHGINTVHRSAELQIRLTADDRGKGYGTEAVQLLLQFGFIDLNLYRIYLHVFENNSRAIAVYEKTGFVREGTLRQAAYVSGAYTNVVVMGVLREDYDGL
ncbi:MAG: GNAT family N-acetyltransferase [Pyrinomonadaceae bacterium]